MIRFLQHCPLLLFVLVLYNLVAFTKTDLVYVPASDSPADSPKIESPAPATAQANDSQAATDDAAPGTGADDVVEVEPAPAEEKPAKKANQNSPATGKPLFKLTLPSSAVWAPTFSDLMLLLAIILLYFELFKSTQTSNTAIVEHVFSIFVFLIFLIEFIVVEACGTSTFLLITLLSFIDVAAGLTMTISTARRDFGVGAHGMPG